MLWETSAVMPDAIGQFAKAKHLNLETFRKTGVGVRTPVWFADDPSVAATTFYVYTLPDSGKVKRIRNNPNVKIAPCTIRGRITGPEFKATARFLPPEEGARVREAIKRKYWLARLPFLWRNTNTYLEIALT